MYGCYAEKLQGRAVPREPFGIYWVLWYQENQGCLFCSTIRPERQVQEIVKILHDLKTMNDIITIFPTGKGTFMYL